MIGKRTNEPEAAAVYTNEPKTPSGSGTSEPEDRQANRTNEPETFSPKAEMSSTLATRMAGRGAIGLYQDTMVGNRSWLGLIRYELVAGFGGVLPGALGLAFRKLFWKGLFARCGGNAVFGRGVVLRQPGKMVIGRRVLVDDDTLLDAKQAPVGGFVLGDDVLISRGCTIVASLGSLAIGDRVNIGNGCTIMAGQHVEIGADTLLAAHCYIGGGSYAVDGSLDQPMATQPLGAGPIRIGPDCWLGAGAVVLSGVSIGRGVVIGGGAVVTKDIPDFAIVTGVPATIRRFRKLAPSR